MAARTYLPDWFLCGMMLAVMLAWLLPEPGAAGGSLHPELLTKAGIALIFFLHGALLSFTALKEGVARWPLHLIIQLTTFLLFPLLGLALITLAAPWVSDALRIGLFYLCALPSTVSSSVAMTAAARGNVPVAVFNATLSSILGIFLTPLWMHSILPESNGSLDTTAVILDLVQWLLMPLIIGQLVRPWIGRWLTQRKPYVNKIDRLIILLLVYTSFCDSFAQNIWSNHGTVALIVSGMASVLLLILLLVGLSWLSRRLSLAPDERAAVVFCGTKKSLATGVPMAQLLFAGNPQMSLFLLPIMIYHSLQLFVCAALANRWAREASRNEAELQ